MCVCLSAPSKEPPVVFFFFYVYILVTIPTKVEPESSIHAVKQLSRKSLRSVCSDLPKPISVGCFLSVRFIWFKPWLPNSQFIFFFLLFFVSIQWNLAMKKKHFFFWGFPNWSVKWNTPSDESKKWCQYLLSVLFSRSFISHLRITLAFCVCSLVIKTRDGAQDPTWNVREGKIINRKRFGENN